MQPTAITYARKSIRIFGLEDERQSILYQLDQMNEYAKDNNLNVIETYSDIGYSGVLKSRPELNKMLEDLKAYISEHNEPINYLLIYSQDRLARDLMTSIELMLEITQIVEEIVFVAEGESSNVPNFRQKFLINAARAAEHRRHVKMVLRNGRRAKVRYAKFLCATFKPLGYMQPNKEKLILTSTSQTMDLKLNNDLVIVQCIFLAYLSRMSLRQIAAWLNEEFGLTTRGKKWNYKSVQYILKNPIYAGILSSVFISKENVTPVNTVEPMIDTSLYDYVQRRLDTESSGRKSKLTTFIPDVTLCFNCLTPLILEKGLLACRTCEGELPIEWYMQKASETFSNFLKGLPIFDVNLGNLLKEKKQQIEVKLFNLRKTLESLKEREKEIGHLYFLEKNLMDELIKVNQKEQVEVEKTYYYEKDFYEYLFGSASKEIETEPHTVEPLLVLPYLMLFDFQKKELYIKFHQDIFVGGKHDGVRVLYENDQGVRLCANLG